MAPLVMDLWALSSDFPYADVIADRFRRMLPAQAQDEHPDPRMQQMQQMLAQQHQVMQQQAAELNQFKMQAKAKDQDAEREWYDSETKRLTAVGGIDPLALRPVVRSLVSEILGMHANSAIAMHVAEDARMHHAAGLQSPHAAPLPPPPPGATAPEGPDDSGSPMPGAETAMPPDQPHQMETPAPEPAAPA
jgi:hypothetical protein